MENEGKRKRRTAVSVGSAYKSVRNRSVRVSRITLPNPTTHFWKLPVSKKVGVICARLFTRISKNENSFFVNYYMLLCCYGLQIGSVVAPRKVIDTYLIESSPKHGGKMSELVHEDPIANTSSRKRKAIMLNIENVSMSPAPCYLSTYATFRSKRSQIVGFNF